MTLEVNVDQEQLDKLVTSMIARSIFENQSIKYDAKQAIGAAVKEYIYSNKEEIIERVVERASREIVKKGLPKLLERVR